MREIKMTMWVTLDGYIADTNAIPGFVGTYYDQMMGEYEDAFVSAADTMLLGLTTYRSFAGSWPHVEVNPEADENERNYARKLGDLRKIVYSSTLENADWRNTSIRKTIDVDELTRLKAEDGKDIIIYGSQSIVRQLSEHGLIDEYQLLIHPLILGAGKAMYQGFHERSLKLVETKTFPSSVLLLRYRKA